MENRLLTRERMDRIIDARDDGEARKLLATGLTAAVCCTAALSMGQMSGFFVASGLWAVGCMCDTSVLPPDPEEETPGEDAGISGPAEDPQ